VVGTCLIVFIISAGNCPVISMSIHLAGLVIRDCTIRSDITVDLEVRP
jgi:hypothetical protein